MLSAGRYRCKPLLLQLRDEIDFAEHMSCLMERRHRIKLAEVCIHRRAILKRKFGAWREALAEKKQTTARLKQCTAFWMFKSHRLVWNSWMQFVATVKSHRVQELFNTWVNQTSVEREIRANVLRKSRYACKQIGILGKCFHKWKQVHWEYERQCLYAATYVAKKFRKKKIYEKVFAAFTFSLELKMNLVRLCSIFRVILMRLSFQHFRLITETQNQKQEEIRRLHDLRLLKKCWHCMRVPSEVSQVSLFQKRYFMRWSFWVNKRKILVKVISRIVLSPVVVAFQQWYEAIFYSFRIHHIHNLQWDIGRSRREYLCRSFLNSEFSLALSSGTESMREFRNDLINKSLQERKDRETYGYDSVPDEAEFASSPVSQIDFSGSDFSNNKVVHASLVTLKKHRKPTPQIVFTKPIVDLPLNYHTKKAPQTKTPELFSYLDDVYDKNRLIHLEKDMRGVSVSTSWSSHESAYDRMAMSGYAKHQGIISRLDDILYDEKIPDLEAQVHLGRPHHGFTHRQKKTSLSSVDGGRSSSNDESSLSSYKSSSSTDESSSSTSESSSSIDESSSSIDSSSSEESDETTILVS